MGAGVTIFQRILQVSSSILDYSDELSFVQSLFYADETQIPSDYNPISIPSYLRLDLGMVWKPSDRWEIGLFGRDLLSLFIWKPCTRALMLNLQVVSNEPSF